MFFIKKMLGAVLMPLPLLLILGLIGCFLLWRGKRVLTGKIIVSTAFFLLFVLSLSPVSNQILIPLESHYEAYAGQPVDYVVVLGGWHSSREGLPVTSLLGSASNYRLLEGLRIAFLNPQAKVILSGYGREDPISNAEAYSQLAQALAFPAERLILQPEPKDTHDEAKYTKQRVGGASIALVTSASHMPRAMALFEHEGVRAVAAPTEFLARASRSGILKWLPNEQVLHQSKKGWHEWLGHFWSMLRGQI